ncbi:hypothetical protein [Spongiibacter pelagi]|nr:hypothetical protein [Spongiibacter pelagi]
MHQAGQINLATTLRNALEDMLALPQDKTMTLIAALAKTNT